MIEVESIQIQEQVRLVVSALLLSHSLPLVVCLIFCLGSALFLRSCHLHSTQDKSIYGYNNQGRQCASSVSHRSACWQGDQWGTQLGRRRKWHANFNIDLSPHSFRLTPHSMFRDRCQLFWSEALAKAKIPKKIETEKYHLGHKQKYLS